jgi:hypothetical protein
MSAPNATEINESATKGSGRRLARPAKERESRRWAMDNEIKQVEWFDDRFYKVNVSEDPKKPVYEYFASATTKLGVVGKPHLGRWRGDIGNREADLRMFEAGERGTRIHHAWYTLTTGGAVIYNPWNRPNYTPQEITELTDKHLGNLAVMQYQDEMYDVLKLEAWVKAVKPKILMSEKAVYSLKYKDAGTLDNLMAIEEGDYEINGSKPLHLPKGIYVVDLKTGSLDEDSFMQLACYANCVSEIGKQAVIGTLILHTGSSVKKAIEGLSTVYHDQSEVDKDFQDFRHASALWERKNAGLKPKIFEFPTLITLKGDSK